MSSWRFESVDAAGVTIRKVGPEEEEATGRLLVDVYLSEGWGLSAQRERLLDTRGAAEEGLLLVAVDQKEGVIGTVLLSAFHRLGVHVAVQGEVELRRLAVCAAWRGAGVGSSLVDECVAAAVQQGFGAITLWARPAMEAAQRLYERRGFVRTPERDFELPRPEGTARTYRLALSSDASSVDPEPTV